MWWKIAINEITKFVHFRVGEVWVALVFWAVADDATEGIALKACKHFHSFLVAWLMKLNSWFIFSRLAKQNKLNIK